MKVSWDDEIPNWMENNPNVPNHQPNAVVSEATFWVFSAIGSAEVWTLDDPFAIFLDPEIG